MTKAQTDIVIIGGGISGLHTAYELQKQGIDFILLEARERLGGRVLSRNYAANSVQADTNPDLNYDAQQPAYDLGPSWFWPGQTNMEALIKELKLADSVFLQQGTGEAVYEDQQGNIQKGFFGISMEGTYRMQGGIRQITDALTHKIDETNQNQIKTQSMVKSVEYENQQFLTTVVDTANDKNTKNDDSASLAYQITSNKVIMALPPRIALSSIAFDPSLSKQRIQELNGYSTWMAGHAKFIAVYESAFWLEQGLSGDAVSQLGPLREIHDASSASELANGAYALFGFVGVPGSYRKGNEDDICNAALDQLIRLFGKEAANPVDIMMQDWAQQVFTATEMDQSMSGGHATSSMSHYTEADFDDCLIWSGTETANHRQGHNGLLEGALEASARTLKLIL